VGEREREREREREGEREREREREGEREDCYWTSRCLHTHSVNNDRKGHGSFCLALRKTEVPAFALLCIIIKGQRCPP